METTRDFILGGSKITADGDAAMKLRSYDCKVISLQPIKINGKQTKKISFKNAK